MRVKINVCILLNLFISVRDEETMFFKAKITIRDGGNTAFYTAYTVCTVYTAYAVYSVQNYIKLLKQQHVPTYIVWERTLLEWVDGLLSKKSGSGVDWMDDWQGGKSWQPFGEGKNGQKSFVWRIFAIVATKAPFFRVLANSIQYNTQYISCNSALLAQETLFLTPKGTFLPKDLQKVHNRDKS